MFKTIIVTDFTAAEDIAGQIRYTYFGIIGFDTETYTKNLKTEPVDVIQMYVPWKDRGPCCYIFHVAAWEKNQYGYKQLPNNLSKILTSKQIVKICSAPEGDRKWLYKTFGVNFLGCIDLQTFAIQKGESSIGLDSLAVKYIPNWKCQDKSMRMSRWDLKLDKDMIHYASMDAYASYQIMFIMYPEFFKDLELPDVDIMTLSITCFEIVKKYLSDDPIPSYEINRRILSQCDFGKLAEGFKKQISNILIDLWRKEHKIRKDNATNYWILAY